MEDGILFSHFEYTGSNFDIDMSQMGDEVTKEWWKLTDPMQEPLDTRKDGEWWASMELLYQMEKGKLDYENAKRYAFYGKLKQENTELFNTHIKQVDESFLDLLLSKNIQNWTVYKHLDMVYYYYEYVGEDISKDISNLEKTKEFIEFSNRIEPLFIPLDENEEKVWHYMTEVFHMD